MRTLSILAVLVLAGCTTTGTGVTVLRADIPDSLLQCKPQPASPVGGTQRRVGLYVIDLADAGQDCRQKLNTVAGLLDDKEGRKGQRE